MTKKTEKKNILNDAIIKDIGDAVHGIDHGAVTITIHEGRIVRIDVTKSSRYDAIWTIRDGDGI